MPISFCLFLLLILAGNSCSETTTAPEIISPDTGSETVSPAYIREIPLPPGFNHMNGGDTLYTQWLLDLKLKKDKTVYLHDGTAKANQHIQYAVIDIAIGKKNLLQCADAAIKLRTEYLFKKEHYNEIKLLATSGDEISFGSWLKGIRWKEKAGRLITFTSNKETTNIRNEFNSFLEIAFSYCGTYSLSRQLREINSTTSIQPGDVFVQGGFPGHAVTVMAVAKDKTGKKVFLLSQGYMPAQDLHVLNNYANPGLSPWYSLSELYPLSTPAWEFNTGSLKRW